MQDTIQVRGRDAEIWETFSIEKQPTNPFVTIKNRRHDKYLRVEPDFSISGTATVITDASLFLLIAPNGGHVPTGLRLSDLASLQG